MDHTIASHTNQSGTAASGSLEALLAAGFTRTGSWQLGPEGRIRFDGQPSREAGVYAHVVGGEVQYVGRAQRGLHRRMNNYAVPRRLRTAGRIHEAIGRALAGGGVVETFMLVPDPLVWKGLPVDTVAGIEEGLIRQLCPAWNRRGITKHERRRRAAPAG